MESIEPTTRRKLHDAGIHPASKRPLQEWQNEFPMEYLPNPRRGTLTVRIRHRPRGAGSRAKLEAVADFFIDRLGPKAEVVQRRQFATRVDVELRATVDLVKRCWEVAAETRRMDDPHQRLLADLLPNADLA